ncbi:MAG: hypothetical protein IJ469_07885 [Candidatus Methanomethylophilaceae archaeon]|nr:hypothetical protein [Candidatus Methanomethylophilaceae archaeon]
MDSNGDKIIGYFTIGIKCLQVPDNAPITNSMKKKMNIDGRSKVAQSYLIGQLGRDDDSPKGYGGRLLTEAFHRLHGANTIVGCRMVRVDCSDDLIPYYNRHGFHFILKNEDMNLNQMIASI